MLYQIMESCYERDQYQVPTPIMKSYVLIFLKICQPIYLETYKIIKDMQFPNSSEKKLNTVTPSVM